MVDPAAYVLELDSVTITRRIVSENRGERGGRDSRHLSVGKANGWCEKETILEPGVVV